MRRLLLSLLLAAAAPAFAATLQGRVLDASTQQPLAGARVSVVYGPGLIVFEYAHALTDAQGSYVIELPADFQGNVALFGVASGYAGRHHDGAPCRSYISCYYNNPPLTLAPGSVVTRDFALPREAIVSGRVIDEATGAGLADGQVRLSPADGADSSLGGTVSTDADGYFSVDGLHAGRYRLSAAVYPPVPGPPSPYFAFRWPDHYCDEVQVRCNEVSTEPLTLTAGSQLGDTVIPMRRGAFLRARLRSSGNGALVYMAAIAFRPDRPDSGWSGSTAPDNYSQIGPLLPGPITLLLSTSQESYPSLVYPDRPCYTDPCDLGGAVTIDIPATPTTTTLPDLFVAPLRTISGRVTDAANDQPLAGITVAAGRVMLPLILGNWGFQTSASAVTNANGEYRIEGFTGTTTMVRTAQAGRGYLDRAWQNTPCTAQNLFCHDEDAVYDRLGFDTEPHPQQIDFALQHSGAIRGRVRQGGQTLAGYAVSVIPAVNPRLSKPVFTDPQGEFLIDGLDTGDYFLYASPSVQAANNNGTVHPRLPCSVGFINAAPGCDLTRATVFAVQQGTTIDTVEIIIPPVDVLFADGYEP